jgi:hypothetical protein
MAARALAAIPNGDNGCIIVQTIDRQMAHFMRLCGGLP